MSCKSRLLFALLLGALGLWSPGAAAEWPAWRGPRSNGASTDAGLPSSWSPQGENLRWKTEFSGRSTPIVFDGRACVIGRVGQGIARQERVACFDAGTGALLWEHRFNVFHTTIPFNRVGWASLAGDPETGYVYAHGVGGMFICFDREGRVVWEHSLTEEFGRISGYGGRTNTPVVEGDLVILSYLNLGWGEQSVPRHRYFAFDKRSGEVVWVAAPGGRPLDTTYSTPVAAQIGGQRLLIGGNADGAVYALKVRTGEKVWGFKLSKRGINSSVVVEGNRVYAAHSEENIDNTSMGRVVCIDATGAGDLTQTHELWRYDGVPVGYTSPVLHAGRLYVVDNSANLHCLDAASGHLYWKHSLGTVGKGSPVWAEGKLYATEVNGGFFILEPGERGVRVLDAKKIEMPGGRPAEIYGSPAVAYGRVYFATEEGLYCLGRKDTRIQSASPPPPPPPLKGAGRAHIQVVPAEVLASPGETVAFEVRSFDSRGRYLGEVEARWALEDLKGRIGAGGEFTPGAEAGAQAGIVVARVGALSGRARVRVVPPPPWEEDFEQVEIGRHPAHWIGAGSKFEVRQVGNHRVLVKPAASRGLTRSNIYLGTATMKDYTIQAEMMGVKTRARGRNWPDMGLIAQRYTLDLMGNHQRLQLRSWAADLRMARSVDFSWELDTWYTVKMNVELTGDKALVRGKVWPRGEPEPGTWSIVAEDPLPNREGSPGLYGNSPRGTEVYYDHIEVW